MSMSSAAAKIQAEIEKKNKELLALLEKEQKEKELNSNNDEKVILNVGGVIFTTTIGTLRKPIVAHDENFNLIVNYDEDQQKQQYHEHDFSKLFKANGHLKD